MGDDDEKHDDQPPSEPSTAGERWPRTSKPRPPGASPQRASERFPVSGGRFRRRERYPRHRRQAGIDELIGYVIAMRGLTDRVREQCVYLFWRDIVGDRIAKRTLPDAVSEGVLKVHVQTSVWMHELQFHKPRMIVQINDWIAARRVWAGARPLVLDIRFVLGTPREPIADRDQLKRLQLSDRQRRLQARGAIAPPAVTSESDVQAIRAEVSVIEDDDLRALVESVRVTWSR